MVRRWLRNFLGAQRNWREFAFIVPACTGFAVLVSWTGAGQSIEWLLYDTYLRSRPSRTPENRILVVRIEEEDIENLGEWPLSDRTLARVLENLVAHQPRAIGLDLYRNLRVGEGSEDLDRVFQNERVKIFGVRKGIGKVVGASPILDRLGQIGLADLVVDRDGRVRRGLLSIQEEDSDEIRFGLPVLMALHYLSQETLNGEPVVPAPHPTKEYGIQLGQLLITPLAENSGPYVRADTGGYQVLIDYNKDTADFAAVTLSEVLDNTLSPEQVRGKLVFIGSTAPSINDLFRTPFTGKHRSGAAATPGVYIHAQLASQLLSGALDGRGSTGTLSDPWEWLFAFFWANLGLIATGSLAMSRRRNILITIARAAGATVSILITFFGSGYLLFLGGYWVPILPAFMAMTAAAAASIVYQNQVLKFQASYDQLTNVANRRHLDFYLAHLLDPQGITSYILCDIDHFKKFNDTYGHPMGDVCLQEVAKVIQLSAPDRGLVARYGGEEFIIVLPKMDVAAALEVAERVRQGVRALKIDVGANEPPQLSMSLGIAARSAKTDIPSEQTISQADQALYAAKRGGRDRCIVFEPESLGLSEAS